MYGTSLSTIRNAENHVYKHESCRLCWPLWERGCEDMAEQHHPFSSSPFSVMPRSTLQLAYSSAVQTDWEGSWSGSCQIKGASMLSRCQRRFTFDALIIARKDSHLLIYRQPNLISSRVQCHKGKLTWKTMQCVTDCVCVCVCERELPKLHMKVVKLVTINLTEITESGTQWNW